MGMNKILSDSRTYYLAAFILVSVGFILPPMVIPQRPSPQTLDMYKVIEGVKEDDVVLMAWQLDPNTFYDIEPAVLVTTEHLLSKHPKIIMYANSVNSLMLGDRVKIKLFGTEDLRKLPTYGVKIVDLGYVPASIVMILQDIHTTYGSQDRYGTPFDRLPLMKSVRKGTDIDLFFIQYGGAGMNYVLVRQLGVPKTICTQHEYGTFEEEIGAMYKVGMLNGYIEGTRGVSEYIGVLGKTESPAARYTLPFLFMIVFIFAGLIGSNVARVLIPYLRKRK